MLNLKKILLKILEKLDASPEVYRSSANTAIATAGIDTYTNGASIIVPSGTYVVTASWNFNTGSSSGARNIGVRINVSAGTMIGGTWERIYPTNSSYAGLSCATILTTTVETTITVQGASSMTYANASGNGISAVRIGNA